MALFVSLVSCQFMMIELLYHGRSSAFARSPSRSPRDSVYIYPRHSGTSNLKGSAEEGMHLHCSIVPTISAVKRMAY